MRSVSTVSQAAKSCVSTGGSLVKRRVVRCANFHFCPPSGSADFLSDTMKRMVKVGLTLENECRG